MILRVLLTLSLVTVTAACDEIERALFDVTGQGTTLAVAKCVERNKKDEEALGISDIRALCAKKNQSEIPINYISGSASYETHLNQVTGFAGTLKNEGKKFVITKITICVEHKDNVQKINGREKVLCDFIFLDNLWIAPGETASFNSSSLKFKPDARTLDVSDDKKPFNWLVTSAWGVNIKLR